MTRAPAGLMKLIIEIPCLNQESWLPLTLSHFPPEAAGFGVVDPQRGQPPPAGAPDRKALEV